MLLQQVIKKGDCQPAYEKHPDYRYRVSAADKKAH